MKAPRSLLTGILVLATLASVMLWAGPLVTGAAAQQHGEPAEHGEPVTLP